MTSAMSGGRHLHLVEYPSDRLTPLRQEYVGLTSENGALVANIPSQPKFLGFCCRPAASSCCGCSLQFALRAFAIVALVLGILGLMSTLVSVGMIKIWWTIESLIWCQLLLALGICLWNTAGEVNPKWGDLSLYFLAGVYVMDVIDFMLLVSGVYFPWFAAGVINGSSNRFELPEYPELIDVDAESFGQTLAFVALWLVASVTCRIIFKGFLYLLLSYYIWSFIVRAKNGEYFLLTLGPHDLLTFVLHPVAPQPNSQTELSQRQPTAPQLPEHFYRVEGSQVQQSAMQAAPHAQPPPQ